MNSLLLHAQTQKSLDDLIHNRPHAILLTGPPGAGKMTAARLIAAELLELPDLSRLQNQPFLKEINPVNGTIGIENIRGLHQFLQLKTTGRNEVRRVVLVEAADSMTAEAQNALLKALEEPPADTVIVLTADNKLKLRPTILSRVQEAGILPVSLDEAKAFLKGRLPEPKIQSIYALSRGYAGLIMALAEQDKDHELFSKVSYAKVLIAAPVFERLKNIDQLSKEKDGLGSLLQGLRLIYNAALENTAGRTSHKQVARINKSLRAVYETEAALNHKPNTKLLLTNLMLNL